MIDLGLNCYQYDDCLTYLEKWGTWCLDHNDRPLAMLPITSDYMTQTIDAKSRNMIRKAAHFYYYQVFHYNHHLEEIFKINISMPERQGKPMSPVYLTRPEPIKKDWVLCNTKHRYVFLGGFNEQHELRAYCALAIVGQVAIINTILGHCYDLPNGVMNGLIAHIVDYLQKTTGVIYLNYLDLINCSEGLRRFKTSVGFQEVVEHFDY